MSSVHSYRPWGEISRDFLTESQREFLTDYAAGTLNWAPGRQGTGYQKLDIRRMTSCREMHAFAYEAVEWMVGEDSFEDVWDRGEWDLYMIRYPAGSYAPPHKDPAPHSQRHRRVNALVSSGASSQFWLEWAGELVQPALDPGDAVMFYPSEVTHGVQPSIVDRLVISCGVVLGRGTLGTF